MDDETRDIIQEQTKLIRENLELTRKNTKRIRKIHVTLRRSFWAKIIYWVIILLITAGAFYLIKPFFENSLQQYRELSDQVKRTTGYINNPEQFIQDAFNGESESELNQQTEIQADASFDISRIFSGLLPRSED